MPTLKPHSELSVVFTRMNLHLLKSLTLYLPSIIMNCVGVISAVKSFKSESDNLFNKKSILTKVTYCVQSKEDHPLQHHEYLQLLEQFDTLDF